MSYTDMNEYTDMMREAENVEPMTDKEIEAYYAELEARTGKFAGITRGIDRSYDMHHQLQPRDPDYLYRCFLSR